MYLYRALNDIDDNNYYNNKNIVASKMPESVGEILNDVAYHVANASSEEQKDCWISAGKDLNIIIREYALPQGGNYNTWKKRKNIAVINLDYWKKSEAKMSDCYTTFLNGENPIIDFSMISITNADKKYEKTKEIKDTLNTFWMTDKDNLRALFDCSQYGDYDSAFNKMSIMRFSSARKAFKMFDRGLTAVQNGIAQKAKEVLCYKEIPKQAIVTVLSPLQEDIIYLLDENDKITFIEALKSGTQVYWDETDNKVVVQVDNKHYEVLAETGCIRIWFMKRSLRFVSIILILIWKKCMIHT